MSPIILSYIEKFIFNNRTNSRLVFYSLVFLSRMELVNSKEYLEGFLKLLFELFDLFSKDEDIYDSEVNSKNLTLILKTINIITRFCEAQGVDIKTLIQEKLEILFKLSHSNSLKLKAKILKLIFHMIHYHKQDEANRYFKSLYEMVLQLPSFSHQDLETRNVLERY